MNKQTKRREELVRIIKAQGMLPAKTLASMLLVSEMTVRRDLHYLQFQPANNKDDGELNDSGSTDQSAYHLFDALEMAHEQKNRIGKFAASLIEQNDVIVIDTGSTTASILSHIPQDKNLTVLCYNANVLLELRHNYGISLLFCGGTFHRGTEMFESPEGIEFIERTRVNKTFLSAAGVHSELGITCVNSYEVATKKAVIASSHERILVIDSSKFDRLRPAYFCDLSDIHTIVTDKNLPDHWREIIERNGITLHLV